MSECHQEFRLIPSMQFADAFNLFFAGVVLLFPFILVPVFGIYIMQAWPAVAFMFVVLLFFFPVWMGIALGASEALKRVRKITMTDSGLQCRTLLSSRFIPYADLTVDYSEQHGVIRSGKRLQLSNYYGNFQQLVSGVEKGRKLITVNESEED